MSWRVSVDIGGTFTDFCAFDGTTGAVRAFKALSTPETPGAEVEAGLRALAGKEGVAPEAIAYLTHGTTVGVNTVIQRRGSPLALLTTRGFEDVLVLARLKVPDPYDMFSRIPEPLAPRERVYGVVERTLAGGAVEREVDPESVYEAARRARADGAETVVVSLLHAYANPANERRVRELVRAAAPGLRVVLSSEVWPVIREYERTVTATVAGYVEERVAGYIDSLQRALTAAGVAAEPMLTRSDGGVMRAELGKSRPIATLLSGTASGVIGAARIAGESGLADAISFDVGGTSADVALIRGGEPAYGVGEMVGEFPIFVPTVSVTSIGAGGGSIAAVDSFGVLKVGPESAGANPGPACYGRGGDRATVTDACAALGYLGGEEEFGYGAVALDGGAARRAVGKLAARLGRSLEETAAAILEVCVAGMYMEVSKLLARGGADPRAFWLLAFGGAGPLSACLLARELALAGVLVPPAPGVLSAWGGLVADVRSEFLRTVFVDLDAADAAGPIRAAARALEAAAMCWLREEQGFGGDARLEFSADLRYRGQSYEVETKFPAELARAGDCGAIAAAFHGVHERVYGHSDPAAPAQMVNLRAVVTGRTPKPAQAAATPAAASPPSSERAVFVDGSWRPAAVYRRADLSPGHAFAGPAIVGQADATTWMPPGFRCRVDDRGNLAIQREG